MSKATVENHQNKCRCCFIKLNKRQTNVMITSEIEENFLSVAQIELKASRNYSSLICIKCKEKLQEFVDFKNDIVKKQKKLYELCPDNNDESVKSEPKFVAVNIKEEFRDEDLIEVWNTNSDFLRENFKDYQEPSEEAKERQKIMESAPASSRRAGICPDCGEMKQNVRKHWLRKHSKIINCICDLCGYGCLYKTFMTKHMRSRHIPREFRQKFKCSFCKFESVDSKYLLVHEKFHNPANRVWDCHCGKSFFNKAILANHQKFSHERDYKFKCKTCAQNFPSRTTLEDHNTLQHIKKDIRDQICPYCAKGFKTEKQLKYHEIFVHSEGPLKCHYDGCEKAFHKQSILERHFKSHTGQKDFRCDKCPAAYSHSTHLYRHQEIVHVGVKIHCEVPGCTTTFVRRDNYQNHLKKTHRQLDPDYINLLLKKSREPDIFQKSTTSRTRN